MADIIQINDSSWRIEDNGVRFFLMAGTEKALLIDSGMNTPDARQIAESITKLPVMLLNTHADPDHISGNGSFDHFYMHPDDEDIYLAFLPIGDLYTMGPKDALKAVRMIRPRHVVPIHYNTFPGIVQDPQEFKALVEGSTDTRVTVMNPNDICGF